METWKVGDVGWVAVSIKIPGEWEGNRVQVQANGIMSATVVDADGGEVCANLQNGMTITLPAANLFRNKEDARKALERMAGDAGGN